jgi:hypothetical protein
MLIRCSVFDRLGAAFPHLAYEADGVRAVDHFACGIDPATRRYLSEDYTFCARAAGIGIGTWPVDQAFACRAAHLRVILTTKDRWKGINHEFVLGQAAQLSRH